MTFDTLLVGLLPFWIAMPCTASCRHTFSHPRTSLHGTILCVAHLLVFVPRRSHELALASLPSPWERCAWCRCRRSMNSRTCGTMFVAARLHRKRMVGALRCKHGE